jgi:hypothetical protein
MFCSLHGLDIIHQNSDQLSLGCVDASKVEFHVSSCIITLTHYRLEIDHWNAWLDAKKKLQDE